MAYQYEFKAQTIIDEGRTTREAIDEIKNWMSQEHFSEVPEELIVLFLLSCQNVIPQTKNTIKAFFKIKSTTPEFFTKRDVESEELKKATKVVNCISIPERMGDNTVIHFFGLNDTNYQNFDWLLSMKLAYMILDVSQRKNPPNDLVVIIDMKGVGFMHVARFKLSAAKIFLEFLQEAMPLRIKMIHILNSSYIFEKLISLARVFIKTELLAMLKTHPPGTDLTKFQKDYVPASCLPKEYGGELPNCEELNSECCQKLKELKGFFEAEEKVFSCYKKI